MNAAAIHQELRIARIARQNVAKAQHPNSRTRLHRDRAAVHRCSPSHPPSLTPNSAHRAAGKAMVGSTGR